MNAVQNRILAAVVAALLGPILDQKLGLRLSDEQLVELVGLAPVVFHALAALWAKCCAAFVLYFPPPNAQGPTAPKVPS